FQVGEDDEEYRRQVHLFDYGCVDSIGASEVINFVESRYSGEMLDELLHSQRATTIDGFAEIG
ncbi:MAG: hypothetical protein ACR2PG_18730, partial [Hyphomicrobiaceae bacterium]